jgi:hypothetical protein
MFELGGVDTCILHHQYCYICLVFIDIYHHTIIYVFLVDFWDFPTKSLSLVFKFWEAENLIFRILLFQGPYEHLKIEGKIHDQFFIWRSTEGQRIMRGDPRGGKEARWCPTYALFALERRLGPPFI